MSINRVIISGNLTRDPELRSTASGMPVLSLGVAVNDRRRNQQSGEWEDHPNFVDCTMFGNRAESVSRYLSKGSKVAIEGKLRWSQWERDGEKRSKLEVVVDEIEFMSRSEGGQHPAQQYQAPAQQSAAQHAPQAVYGAQQAQYATQPAQYAAPQAQYAPQYEQQQMSVPQAVAPSIYDEDIPF